MSQARRQVELVLTFPNLETSDLRTTLPEPVLLRPNNVGGTLAIIGERSMRASAAETLLDELWASASPILTRLRSEGPMPDAVLLRLVQYIGPDDDVGPGVPIDARWVKALAEFDGVIDIDQYVQERESDG